MSKFNKALLGNIKEKLMGKQAFIPSPQMQEQIVNAQQQGQIPPPEQPPAGADGGSQVGLQELGGMMQQGFDGIMQALQQLAQMIQQQGQMAAAGGEVKEKKLSNTERIDRLEQMLQEAMGGGAPPPQDPAAAGAPPQDPAAAGAPPA